MATESDQTVEHNASDLTIAEEQSTGFTNYSVDIEGQVYHVKARTVKEAASKAKKMHKAGKEQS